MTTWLLNAAPWIGLALAAVGLAGALWALSPWPRSTRRRCPRCWYDMSGTPDSRKCTECGRTAKSERRLHKRRRKWKGALLCAGLVALGVGLAATPDILAGTWHRLLPTSVLYAFDDNSRLGIRKELEQRFRGRYATFERPRPGFWSQWPMSVEQGVLRTQARKRLRFPKSMESEGLAIQCLIAIGPKTDEIALLRTRLRSPNNYWLATLSHSAIEQLGPDGVYVLPELLIDPTMEISLRALRAIGPGAAPAVEPLRVALHEMGPRPYLFGSWDAHLPNDDRALIIDTLGAIGPGARNAVPDILRLIDTKPFLENVGTWALVRIAPNLPETRELVLRSMRRAHVCAHEQLSKALATADASTLKTEIVRLLARELNSDALDTRWEHARALVALGAFSPQMARSLISDRDPLLRMTAVKWALGRDARDSFAHDILAVASTDPDLAVLALALPRSALAASDPDSDGSGNTWTQGESSSFGGGRFRLDVIAVEPDPLPPQGGTQVKPDLLGYRATLVDTQTERVLWIREPLIFPPAGAWIGPDSSVVLCDSWCNFTAIDAVSGEIVAIASRFDLFPLEDWGPQATGRFDQWPAWPLLEHRARFAFFEFRERMYFGGRTSWGRAFVADFQSRRFIHSPPRALVRALDDALNAAAP